MMPIVLIYRMTSAAVMEVLTVILPFYLVFSMFSMVQCLVVDIVTEKETKMKEIMHIYLRLQTLHFSPAFTTASYCGNAEEKCNA